MPGEVLAPVRRLERIGHGGASALRSANTLASFEAARDIGIDHIEFDVRVRRGELVLGHTSLHARHPGRPTLAAALGHLAGPGFTGIGLHLDVKQVGLEPDILNHLDETGLLERTLLCSQIPAVLDRFRQLDDRARVGISVGGRLARASHRWGDWKRGILAGLAAERWHVVMVQHRLADAALIDAVERRGSRLYAWTVNDHRLMESLRSLGVHGITTADPRLFGSAGVEQAVGQGVAHQVGAPAQP